MTRYIDFNKKHFAGDLRTLRTLFFHTMHCSFWIRPSSFVCVCVLRSQSADPSRGRSSGTSVRDVRDGSAEGQHEVSAAQHGFLRRVYC